MIAELRVSYSTCSVSSLFIRSHSLSPRIFFDAWVQTFMISLANAWPVAVRHPTPRSWLLAQRLYISISSYILTSESGSEIPCHPLQRQRYDQSSPVCGYINTLPTWTDSPFSGKEKRTSSHAGRINAPDAGRIDGHMPHRSNEGERNENISDERRVWQYATSDSTIQHEDGD